MKKTVVLTYEEANDAARNHKIAEIVAGGFYEFLKSNGYLRISRERDKKIEKIIENSKRLHDAASDL